MVAAIDVSEHVVEMKKLLRNLAAAREDNDWSMVKALAVQIVGRANDIYLVALKDGKGD